jgi:hypothetical protein
MAMEFLRVGGGDNLDLMKDVQKIFDEVLEPLYGSQKKALRQIEDSSDRILWILHHNLIPVGVLQYKTIPSNEFEMYGIRNSIEVKSLFVCNPTENSGKGYATQLLEKLKMELENLDLPFDSIHLTVSGNVQSSLYFFLKKGFSIKHTFIDRYHRGSVEHLLCYESIQKQHF